MIVQTGDPILRRVAEPVPEAMIGSRELSELIEGLFAALDAVPGVGVAAPQIGVSRRVILIRDPAEVQDQLTPELLARTERTPVEPYVLVNPALDSLGEEATVFFEGCLSVAGYRALVPRHRRVRVRYLDPAGALHDEVRQGWHARILQHEVDHLDGVLYVDRMISRSLVSADSYARWAAAPPEEVLRAFGIAR